MSKRKLVLEEHNGSTLVGVLQDGCDPIIKTTQGGLDEALAAVPDFLKEAQDRWAVAPKNPAYTPPAASKKATTPAAATTPAPEKAEDLPLLAGKEAAPPADAPVESQAPVPTEVPTPEKLTEETAEPPAAPVETEPEPEVPPAEPVATMPVVSGVAEDKVEQEISERIAQSPAPAPAAPAPSTPAKPGEWQYYLQDGRGPLESVQAAMDELGLDKATRPTHNRWDRLSTTLKEKIQRRPKA